MFFNKPRQLPIAQSFVFMSIRLDGTYCTMSYGDMENIAALDQLSSERLQSLKTYGDAIRIVPSDAILRPQESDQKVKDQAFDQYTGTRESF
jgi:hypothetical protein